ncbi:hypothetical protein MCHI_003172 [Candidatus Magnetoovum chiemensis]|nr:hypothetical protein MCHI_003172 [Candidatus Magnetoovum chiemensis]
MCILLLSCVKLTKPHIKGETAPEDITFEELLSRLQTIKEIKGAAFVKLKTPKQTLSGTASITVTADTLKVVIYSLGVPVFEFEDKNGEIYSSQELNKYSELLFSRSVREGLLWWNFSPLKIEKDEAFITISDELRTMYVKTTNLTPYEQRILFYSGDTVFVSYKKNIWIEGVVFPKTIVAIINDLNMIIDFEDIRFKKDKG